MITVSVAAFKAAFPEFTQAPDGLVQAELDFAALKTPESIWGDFTTEGRMLWAARQLAMKPAARHMSLLSKDGTTSYDMRLDALLRAVAPHGIAL